MILVGGRLSPKIAICGAGGIRICPHVEIARAEITGRIRSWTAASIEQVLSWIRPGKSALRLESLDQVWVEDGRAIGVGQYLSWIMPNPFVRALGIRRRKRSKSHKPLSPMSRWRHERTNGRFTACRLLRETSHVGEALNRLGPSARMRHSPSKPAGHRWYKQSECYAPGPWALKDRFSAPVPPAVASQVTGMRHLPNQGSPSTSFGHTRRRASMDFRRSSRQMRAWARDR
jgi:hypothetical protein